MTDFKNKDSHSGTYSEDNDWELLAPIDPLNSVVNPFAIHSETISIAGASISDATEKSIGRECFRLFTSLQARNQIKKIYKQHYRQHGRDLAWKF